METNRRLGLLFSWLTGDHWLCLAPVLFSLEATTAAAPASKPKSSTLPCTKTAPNAPTPPPEFAETFNWKNDPEKAELLGKLGDTDDAEDTETAKKGRLE